MDKIKNKYEVILGFVTLMISFSAFKDELSNINLNLGFKIITLSEYFLYCVYGFSVCLYLYILEIIVRDTKIGNWKIFDLILKFAYILFAVIILSPLLILCYLGLFNLSFIFQKNELILKLTLNILRIILLITTIIYSILVAKNYRKERKNKLQEEAEYKEIKGIDNATRLLKDGYYSHSILEIFKVLETHLNKVLLSKDIRFSKNRFDDLVNTALKQEIIKKEDLLHINEIRQMRNASAHLNTDFTKQQAESSLDFVKQVLKR
jgi:hypothetical protein